LRIIDQQTAARLERGCARPEDLPPDCKQTLRRPVCRLPGSCTCRPLRGIPIACDPRCPCLVHGELSGKTWATLRSGQRTQEPPPRHSRVATISGHLARWSLLMVAACAMALLQKEARLRGVRHSRRTALPSAASWALSRWSWTPRFVRPTWLSSSRWRACAQIAPLVTLLARAPVMSLWYDIRASE